METVDVVKAQTANASDDIAWAERCGHWLSSPVAKRGPGRLPRQRHEPLVLTGHGMGLRVDNGALLVRDGFTHYPQTRKEWRLFPGASNLPSRIVVLDGSGSLSFAVMDWLAEQGIRLSESIGKATLSQWSATPTGWIRSILRLKY